MMPRRYVTGYSTTSMEFTQWLIDLIYALDPEGAADMAHFLYGVNQ